MSWSTRSSATPQPHPLPHHRRTTRLTRPRHHRRSPAHHLQGALAHHLLAAGHPRLVQPHRNPIPRLPLRRLSRHRRPPGRTLAQTLRTLPRRQRPDRHRRRRRNPSRRPDPLPLTRRQAHPYHDRPRAARRPRRPQRLPLRPYRPPTPAPQHLAPTRRRLHLVAASNPSSNHQKSVKYL